MRQILMNCQHSRCCLIDDEFNLRVTGRCSKIFNLPNDDKWHKIDNLPPLLQVVEVIEGSLVTLIRTGQLLYIDKNKRMLRDYNSISLIKYIDYWSIRKTLLVIVDSRHRLYILDTRDILNDKIQPTLLSENVDAISWSISNGLWLSESSIFAYNQCRILPYEMNGIRIIRLIDRYAIDEDNNIYNIDILDRRLVKIRQVDYEIKDISYKDWKMIILDYENQLHTYPRDTVRSTNINRFIHFHAYRDCIEYIDGTTNGLIPIPFKLLNLD